MEQAEAGPADPPRQVIREDIAAAQFSDSSDGEQLRQHRGHGRRRRQRKRFWQNLYVKTKKRITSLSQNKVCKLMRMIGVSSSSDEN